MFIEITNPLKYKLMKNELLGSNNNPITHKKLMVSYHFRKIYRNIITANIYNIINIHVWLSILNTPPPPPTICLGSSVIDQGGSYNKGW